MITDGILKDFYAYLRLFGEEMAVDKEIYEAIFFDEIFFIKDKDKIKNIFFENEFVDYLKEEEKNNFSSFFDLLIQQNIFLSEEINDRDYLIYADYFDLNYPNIFGYDREIIGDKSTIPKPKELISQENQKEKSKFFNIKNNSLLQEISADDKNFYLDLFKEYTQLDLLHYLTEKYVRKDEFSIHKNILSENNNAGDIFSAQKNYFFLFEKGFEKNIFELKNKENEIRYISNIKDFGFDLTENEFFYFIKKSEYGQIKDLFCNNDKEYFEKKSDCSENDIYFLTKDFIQEPPQYFYISINERQDLQRKYLDLTNSDREYIKKEFEQKRNIFYACGESEDKIKTEIIDTIERIEKKNDENTKAIENILEKNKKTENIIMQQIEEKEKKREFQKITFSVKDMFLAEK